MPIRNPFARARPGVIVTDDNARSDRNDAPGQVPGLYHADSTMSTTSSIISIQSRKSQDKGEYKMSVVNDSGVFLPPSPTLDQGVWPRKYLSSRTSTETWSSSIGEIEPFSISRESFDSYRRSFDITAKSPAVHDPISRQSLDSARFARIPRSSVTLESATDEEDFEDVALDDSRHPPALTTRRRGFFSKFSDPQDSSGRPPVTSPTSTPSASVARFLIPGRKRAQSQSKDGAELGTLPRPSTAIQVEEGSPES